MNKIHKPMNKKRKILIILAVIAVVLVQLRIMAFPLLDDYTLYGKRYIGRQDSAYLCEIDFDKLGNYEDYKYQYHRENIAFWSSDSYVLTAEYSEEEYRKQCEYINEYVAFYTESVVNDDYTVFPKAEFEINNWLIKAVASQTSFPHHMHFIGFNEGENKIAYFDFSDTDFDGFADEDYINTFFKEYFHYKFK